jgi:hypothetical protein
VGQQAESERDLGNGSGVRWRGSWRTGPDHLLTEEWAVHGVAPGVDLYRVISTATKTWILRMLFEDLGLESDELLFHLVPMTSDDEDAGEDEDSELEE